MNEREKTYKVCHLCFGLGYLACEGYADCPYCWGTGREEEYEGEDESEQYPHLNY